MSVGLIVMETNNYTSHRSITPPDHLWIEEARDKSGAAISTEYGGKYWLRAHVSKGNAMRSCKIHEECGELVGYGPKKWKTEDALVWANILNLQGIVVFYDCREGLADEVADFIEFGSELTPTRWYGAEREVAQAKMNREAELENA